MEDHIAPSDGAATVEQVKPYRIHVSSRYLNLTKQKLEITRLPHELDEPKSKDWWQPKSQVEPLIDFWLEQYQWREQEEFLNTIPQFRTGFTMPQSESPIRIQFIHVRSTHANAIPLLLIPPFPFPSLSMGHLVKLFTDPEDAQTHQPFHLVIPSLPGLGFSDALPTNTAVISSTAELLDALMKRLRYSFYLVTNAGAGTSSPAHIDYRLAEWLSTQYPDSCLGTHLISPPLTKPKLQEAPLEWAKWSIASFFKAPILGYSSDDFSALKQQQQQRSDHTTTTTSSSPSKKKITSEKLGLQGKLDLTEPNTLAYALCDSPTGLLVFVMKGLRLLAPDREFTATEIINFTQLAWIPGPEAAMRFWAHCRRHPEQTTTTTRSGGGQNIRPRVALTVFLGGSQQENSGQAVVEEEGRGGEEKFPSPYTCPSWARTKYQILHTVRASGRPGLLAFERPELIAAGVRGLATALLKTDARLQTTFSGPDDTITATVPLEQVIAISPDASELPPSTWSQSPQPQSPQPQAQTTKPGLLAPPKKPTQGQRIRPAREMSDDTKVASDESLFVPSPGLDGKTPTPSPIIQYSTPTTPGPSPVKSPMSAPVVTLVSP